MKIKDLKIGIVMALTVIFMGTPMIKASAAQGNSDNATSNINQTECVTTDGTATTTEDLTTDGTATTTTNEDGYFTDEYFTNGFSTEDEYGYFTEDEDLTKDNGFTYDTNFDVDQSQFEITYDQKEYVDFYKKAFREKFGTEDKFITTYKDEYVKEEVNPATTEVKLTDMKTNEVVDSYNYFEDTLDPRLMNEEESAKYVEEQIEEAREVFHKQYGTEDKFQTISEDEYTIEEVNGATGEYRTTDKRTRSLTDTYNYLDELNDLEEKVESAVADMHK